MVSSLSLQARGSSGCLLKKPPHYLHCTRGRCSTSPLPLLRAEQLAESHRGLLESRPPVFLHHRNENYRAATSSHTLCVSALQLLRREGEPSLARKGKCFASCVFLCAAFLECKIKNTDSQCLAFFFFFFFFLPPFKLAQVFQVLSLFQRQSRLGCGCAPCE